MRIKPTELMLHKLIRNSIISLDQQNMRKQWKVWSLCSCVRSSVVNSLAQSWLASPHYDTQIKGLSKYVLFQILHYCFSLFLSRFCVVRHCVVCMNNISRKILTSRLVSLEVPECSKISSFQLRFSTGPLVLHFLYASPNGQHWDVKS